MSEKRKKLHQKDLSSKIKRLRGILKTEDKINKDILIEELVKKHNK